MSTFVASTWKYAQDRRRDRIFHASLAAALFFVSLILYLSVMTAAECRVIRITNVRDTVGDEQRRRHLSADESLPPELSNEQLRTLEPETYVELHVRLQCEASLFDDPRNEEFAIVERASSVVGVYSVNDRLQCVYGRLTGSHEKFCIGSRLWCLLFRGYGLASMFPLFVLLGFGAVSAFAAYKPEHWFSEAFTGKSGKRD